MLNIWVTSFNLRNSSSNLGVLVHFWECVIRSLFGIINATSALNSSKVEAMRLKDSLIHNTGEFEELCKKTVLKPVNGSKQRRPIKPMGFPISVDSLFSNCTVYNYLPFEYTNHLGRGEWMPWDSAALCILNQQGVLHTQSQFSLSSLLPLQIKK